MACKDFIFTLRHKDCLAFKWIEDNAGGEIWKDDETGLELGVSITGIAKYFFETCHLSTVFPSLYTGASALESRITNLSIDTEAVAFGDFLTIPIPHVDKESHLSDDTEAESVMEVYKAENPGLEDLDDDDFVEMIMVLMHTRADLRDRDGVKDKSYSKVTSGGACGSVKFFEGRYDLIIPKKEVVDITASAGETVSDVGNCAIWPDQKKGQLKLLFEDPLSGDKIPLPVDLEVKITIDDDVVGTDRIFHADGLIMFSCPLNEGFSLKFEPEKPYFNITEKKVMSQAELDQAISDNDDETTPPYLQANRIIMFPEEFSFSDSRWELGSTDNAVLEEFNDDGTISVYPDQVVTLAPEGEVEEAGDSDDGTITIGGIQVTAEWLEVTLKPACKHIRFEYLDMISQTIEPVPPYIFLEVYDENTLLAKSNLYDDTGGVILLPIFKRKEVKAPVLKFGEEKVFIRNTPFGGTFTRELKRGKGVDEYPDTDKFDIRLQYYDLPKKWESRNWMVTFDTNLEQFEDVFNENTAPAKPIIFNLDHVVLAENNSNPRYIDSWRKKDRFTVFDLTMTIVHPDNGAADPDDHRPFLTTGTLEKNFFTHEVLWDPAALVLPRMISLNGEFYDVTFKRTESGKVIGARAAVKNDEDVHYGEKLKEQGDPAMRDPANPNPANTGERRLGNFELHLLKYGLEIPAANVTPRNHLLIYWSAKFQKDGCFSGVKDHELKKFASKGMLNSKIRWEQKGHLFKPTTAAVSPDVRPVFFFEARERDPYKCVEDIRKGKERSSMGLDHGYLHIDDFEPGTPPPGYARFTMAHELGHAIGLLDEYREAIKKPYDGAPVGYPRIGRYRHYYPAMPYALDRRSMMKGNGEPRLRHMWFFCRWINGEAVNAGGKAKIQNLTGNTTYQVFCNSTRIYNLFLKDAFKNFLIPAEWEKASNMSTAIDGDADRNGKYDLYLYMFGDDETGDIIEVNGNNSLAIDSILVVTTFMQWTFGNNGANTWTSADKVNHLSAFQSTVESYFDEQCMLEYNAAYDAGGTAPDIKKPYIHFIPLYRYENQIDRYCSPSDYTHQHFKIKVIKNSDKLPELNAANTIIEVGELYSKVALYRFILGMSWYTPAIPPALPIADFESNILNIIPGAADKTFVSGLYNKTATDYNLISPVSDNDKYKLLTVLDAINYISAVTTITTPADLAHLSAWLKGKLSITDTAGGNAYPVTQ